MDSHDAVIARTGFFVLSSVFKERPGRGKPKLRTRPAHGQTSALLKLPHLSPVSVPVRRALEPL
jgi:hypothetical protein